MGSFLLLFVILVGYCGCTSAQVEKGEDTIIVEVEYLGSDTCVYLQKDGKPFTALRTLEILENTVTDTITLGFSVIPGGYKGRVGYHMFENDRTAPLYSRSFEETNMLPKTDRLWIFPFHQLVARGRMKIKFIL